jgi:hypothetical protein
MPLLETKGAASAQGFGFTSGGAAPVYVEDVFSTWLYNGNGSTQTITNGIDLSTKGGMVWIKDRTVATNNALFDTNNGATKYLQSDSTTNQNTNATTLTAFNSNGFALGNALITNANASAFVSWAFRKQLKFFDVVTYTGNGANRTIAHNLGSVPGCIIIKSTSNVGTNWAVYHRSIANTDYLSLNLTNAVTTNNRYWNNTTPTSTVFSLGDGSEVNANGWTYVAYLFAHNAGGFGASGSDNVISCGSVTTNGSGVGSVNLGWEPQWVLVKVTNTTNDWRIIDNMRGFAATYIANGSNQLRANTTGAESDASYFCNSTGFTFDAGVSQPFIYIAIRRGPMRTPTTGTSVFTPTVYTGTNVDNRLVNTTIAPDMVWVRQRDSTTVAGMVVGDRLRSQPYLLTGSTAAEVNDANSFDAQLVSGTEYGNAFSSMNGFWVGNDATSQLNASTTASNQIAEAFKRAPGFFDVVCYTGTGAAAAQTHNLGVVPELMIVKKRSAADDWAVYANNDNTDFLLLNTTAATADDNTYWNDTSPTASVFTVGTNADVNTSAATYVAYLFATVAGVSKVGSYTGTGTTLQVNCGFTGGSRFVLIKRTDSTGDWYVWDSARGIVAGNDPYLLLNSTAAEVTGTDYIDTFSSGFEISSTAPAAINANGGTFIFLAIA